MQKTYFTRMYRTSSISILLSVLLLLVAACGPEVSTTTTTTTNTTGTLPFPVPDQEKVYILNGYTTSTSTPLQIVGFHPGDAHQITLPAGLISQDHQRIYTATAQNGKTTITVTNTQTGQVLRRLSISGNYSTADHMYTKAVMSFDGRWLALLQQDSASTISTVALVDTQAGKLAKTLRFPGNFDLDALSPDGNSVYLLEHLSDSSGHYNVRLYQVDQNKLYDYPIIDKQDLDPRMLGSALTRQMALDGSVAYTLYVDTAHNIAFVHMLPLDGTSFPFARCINLPAGTSADLLRYYTLKLSADGSTLYAANGALGVVTAITNITGDAQEAQAKTVHFNVGSTSGAGNTHAPSLYNGAVLSPDQHVLYFPGIRGIWAVDTTSFHLKGSYATQQPFTGLGLSMDGQTLYAVYPASGITRIHIASGQAQQLSPSPASIPWGIEWVSDK